MKSRITKTVALATLMTGAAGVAHATEGWYGRVDAGYSIEADLAIKGNHWAGESALDDDWREFAGLGYAFANGFRLEGELGHRFNELPQSPQTSQGGDVH